MEDKAQLFAAKLSESMHRSRMQYRIQGARMLTGGKSLFLNLPDKLQEVSQISFDLFLLSFTRMREKYPTYPNRFIPKCITVTQRIVIEHQWVQKPFDEDDELTLDEQLTLIEFSTTSYAVLEREQRVDLQVKRKGPMDGEIRFRCLFFVRACSC